MDKKTELRTLQKSKSKSSSKKSSSSRKKRSAAKRIQAITRGKQTRKHFIKYKKDKIVEKKFNELPREIQEEIAKSVRKYLKEIKKKKTSLLNRINEIESVIDQTKKDIGDDDNINLNDLLNELRDIKTKELSTIDKINEKDKLKEMDKINKKINKICSDVQFEIEMLIDVEDTKGNPNDDLSERLSSYMNSLDIQISN